MEWNKKSKPMKAAGLIVLGLALLAGIIIVNRPKTNTDNSFNTISDTSASLVFNMSKDFMPIPKEELATLNPGFNYGFRPAGDIHTSCILSQTALTGSGSLTGVQLRNGILKEVRKIHPDAKLDNPTTASNPVKFGDAKGVLLQITYSEASIKIMRVEILALGKTSQVIAYCQSLAEDNQRYYNDFTTFFSSLKLSR